MLARQNLRRPQLMGSKDHRPTPHALPRHPTSRTGASGYKAPLPKDAPSHKTSYSAHLMSYLLLLLGGVGLYLGGEWLVTHASSLARSMGLSPFVIGLTVVAFGTSAPELAATLTSTLHGATSLALGNVMGSNIANIALVLGATALITSIGAPQSVMRQDFPILLFVTAAAVGSFYFTPEISRAQGVIMLALLLSYIFYQVRTGKADPQEESEERTEQSLLKTILWLLLALATLATGARAMVMGAVDIASSLGISQRIIGLTVVALGTSLPELASSIIAAKRGETDLALGGVIGSNIFNLLGILGATAAVSTLPSPWASVGMDALAMLGAAVLAWLLSFGAKGITRPKGMLLLLAYAGYIASLF